MKRIIEIPDNVLESKHYCQYFGAWSTKLTELIEQSKPYDDSGDLISRETLKKEFEKVYPLASNEMGGVVNKRIYDIIDNAPTAEHSLLPLSGEADNAYMRGYEVGKAEGILKAETRPSEQIAWEQGYEAGLAQGKQDRPQGEWVVVPERCFIYCKECTHVKPFSAEEFKLGINFPKFCEECGADMRKGRFAE